MSETPKQAISEDLAYYSLSKFYKTCMSLLSKDPSQHENSEREKMFINCYVKMSKVFLLTDKFLKRSTSGQEQENTKMI